MSIWDSIGKGCEVFYWVFFCIIPGTLGLYVLATGDGGGDTRPKPEERYRQIQTTPYVQPQQQQAPRVNMNTLQQVPYPATPQYGEEESTSNFSPDDAYEEGFQEGYETGYQDGVNGEDSGCNYNADCTYFDYYEERYAEGYGNGYDEGYENGRDEYNSEREP